MMYAGPCTVAQDCVRSGLSGEGRVSRKQWLVVVVLGLGVLCVFFCAGSYLGIYLTGGSPGLITFAVQPVPTAAEIPSPTAAVATLLSPTATKEPPPSPTPKAEPPTPTNTRVIPLLTPWALLTVIPQEPFVPDQWEPDDAPGEASAIEIGAVQRHDLHVEGDRDWVYFQAEAGRAYVIETSSLEHEMDTVVYLFDEEGNELASDDDGGDEFLASRLWWVAWEDSGLLVVIRGFANTEAGPGTGYDISLRSAEGFEIDPYEPDDSPAQASPIEVGETQSHNRHVSGDEDWLSFEVQQGITYTVQTLNLGAQADTVIYLYDERGAELVFDDDGGYEPWASRLEWMAHEPGILYVKIVEWIQTSSGPATRYDVVLTAP